MCERMNSLHVVVFRTLWCERNAVAFQNVTDGLIGYFMPEVG